MSLPVDPNVELLSEETAWRGRFSVDLIRFRNRRFDGAMSEPKTWELWRRGRAVALLPYDPVSDTVVLIEQFRVAALAAGVPPVMVEIPAGMVDPGEDPAATMLRETHEEIGLAPRRQLPIGDFVLSPGGCDERILVHVGLVTAPAADADGLIGRSGLAAEGEDIQIRLWPAERAIAAALDGAFHNSVTAIALLWLAARHDWLRAQWRDLA